MAVTEQSVKEYVEKVDRLYRVEIFDKDLSGLYVESINEVFQLNYWEDEEKLSPRIESIQYMPRSAETSARVDGTDRYERGDVLVIFSFVPRLSV